jgi:hypothetical protein
MKNKWNIIWNPFTRIAGWQAFFLGTALVFLSAIIGKFANLNFDGAVDAHFYEGQLTLSHVLCVSLIDVLSVFVVMTIGAFILTKNFRIIDILGTITLARAPFILLAIFGLFVTQPNLKEIIENPMIILSYKMFMIFGLFSLPVLVWYIALLYNAFKVSTGATGGKMIAIFISALLIAEIISKVLIMMLCS